MSERKGVMSSAFHRDLVKKRSPKRAAASIGSADEGKYVSKGPDIVVVLDVLVLDR